MLKKRTLSGIIIFLSFFYIGARWNNSVYSDPIKVAQAFLDAIIKKKVKEANKYIIKELRNNNHWVNATKKERKKIFTKWVPLEFRPKGKTKGYVIIKAPYGLISVKFKKENDKWLWANE